MQPSRQHLMTTHRMPFFGIPVARADGSERTPGEPWYRMEAKPAQDDRPATARIDVFGFIGQERDPFTGGKIGVSAQSFVDELKALGDVEEIDAHINSLGGDAFGGSTIYSALVQHPAKVTVVIDGIAGSAASIIAMAGDVIRMSDVGMLMIHNPATFAAGDAQAMRRAADSLDNIRTAMMAAYKRRKPKLSDDELIAALDAETWYTAEAALAVGFCDEIIKSDLDVEANAATVTAAAKIYRNVPQAAIDMVAPEPPPAPPADPVVPEPSAEIAALIAAQAARINALAGMIERLAAPLPRRPPRPSPRLPRSHWTRRPPSSPPWRASRRWTDARTRSPRPWSPRRRSPSCRTGSCPAPGAGLRRLWRRTASFPSVWR